MRHKVKMPKVADSVDEVMILRWLVEEGSSIGSGQPILEVQTDKVDMDVPAPVAGKLVEMLVSPDELVVTGTVICVIEA